MEDVLDVYQRSYDPSRPVVCIDETNKQLIIEKRVPCKPGEPEKLDSVYVRNGVADIFMISEPLAGKRETVVKQTRDRKSTRLNSSHSGQSRMPSSA